MKKLKTLLIAILYVLLFLIINFGVITLFAIGYNIFCNLDINTNEYIESLAIFLNKSKIFIVLVSVIFWIPLLYKNMKKKNICFNMKWQNSFLNFILLGISSSLVLNIIIFDIGLQELSSDISTPIFSIISVAIIGPVLEELVFRGLIYNKLKESYRVGISILLVSLLFGLFHLNLVQGIYAFLISVIITYCYEKSSNLFIPILVHCSANISVSILLPFLLRMSFLPIQIVLVVFLFLSIVCLFKLNTRKIIQN